MGILTEGHDGALPQAVLQTVAPEEHRANMHVCVNNDLGSAITQDAIQYMKDRKKVKRG